MHLVTALREEGLRFPVPPRWQRGEVAITAGVRDPSLPGGLVHGGCGCGGLAAREDAPSSFRACVCVFEAQSRTRPGEKIPEAEAACVSVPSLTGRNTRALWHSCSQRTVCGLRPHHNFKALWCLRKKSIFAPISSQSS